MTNRSGLYLIAGLTLFCSFGAIYQIDKKIIPKLEEVAQIVYNLNSSNGPVIKKENVIGNEQPEIFYEIDGKRAYLSIDGKVVEDYFPKNNQPIANTPGDVR